MIGTELLKGQGLGNQLFCYVTTRCIALKHGYDFSILGREQLGNNIHSQKGLYFMNLDLGVPSQKSDYIEQYWEKEDRLFLPNSKHDLTHGAYITGVDEAILNIKDNVLIGGNLQAEDYFKEYKDEIKKWLKVESEYDSYKYSRDNLCIINMRGGEYESSPELYLSKKYWVHAIAQMKKVRQDMEFLIVTDDVRAANKMLPDIPAIHGSLHEDYVCIKNARYLILSNSSFAFFPVFTSETLKMVIAPKYWARHNVSDGYWASEQNIYEGFCYMDRKGKLFTAEECRAELAQYKQVSKRYGNLNIRPIGIKLLLYKVKSRYIYGRAYLIKIWRGVMRRLKRVEISPMR